MKSDTIDRAFYPTALATSDRQVQFSVSSFAVAAIIVVCAEPLLRDRGAVRGCERRARPAEMGVSSLWCVRARRGSRFPPPTPRATPRARGNDVSWTLGREPRLVRFHGSRDTNADLFLHRVA